LCLANNPPRARGVFYVSCIGVLAVMLLVQPWAWLFS